MKSIAELAELRTKSLNKINMREHETRKKVVVGMGTCGIAAGARTVMHAFSEELNKNELYTVTVGMTGCMGTCEMEPMVDVIDEDGTKTTYVNMTPEKVQRVVADHIVNGQPVVEFTAAGK